jgi:hypothetical protein
MPHVPSMPISDLKNKIYKEKLSFKNIYKLFCKQYSDKIKSNTINYG